MSNPLAKSGRLSPVWALSLALDGAALLRNEGDSAASVSAQQPRALWDQSKGFTALCLRFLSRTVEGLAVTTKNDCCRNSLRMCMQKDKTNAQDRGATVIVWILVFFPGLLKKGIGLCGGFN